MNKNLFKKLISPIELKNKYKLNKNDIYFIKKTRKKISNIINNIDKKFLIILGPCSIVDDDSIIEYSIKINELYKKVKNKIYFVLRTYLEKPRTSIGWKGIINDPYMNNTYDINYGLKISRKILIKLIKNKIPLSTELLNPIFCEYIFDLFSWISIGARTSESQIHREITSYLSTIPIGFKNSTDGSINSCINSIIFSKTKNKFININKYGKTCILNSNGNKNTHIVLRGGKNKPNYYEKNINNYVNIIKKNNLNNYILIDCSHGNSNKDYKIQNKVAKYIINKKIKNKYNLGIMLESNLYEGSQNAKSLNDIKYGISVTDSCIGIEETIKIIKYIYNKI